MAKWGELTLLAYHNRRMLLPEFSVTTPVDFHERLVVLLDPSPFHFSMDKKSKSFYPVKSVQSVQQ